MTITPEQIASLTQAMMNHRAYDMEGVFCVVSREATITAAAMLPQLLTALEAERAKVARLVMGLRSTRAMLDHCIHSEPDWTIVDAIVDAYDALSALLTEIKETDHE